MSDDIVPGPEGSGWEIVVELLREVRADVKAIGAEVATLRASEAGHNARSTEADDAIRKSIDRVNADLRTIEARVRSLEATRSRWSGWVAGAVAVGSLLGAVLSWAVHRIFEAFGL